MIHESSDDMKHVPICLLLQVKLGVYFTYFKAMSIRLVVSFFLLFTISGAFGVGSNFWLANWSGQEELGEQVSSATFVPPNSSELVGDNTAQFLGVYIALGLSQGNF